MNVLLKDRRECEAGGAEGNGNTACDDSLIGIHETSLAFNCKGLFGTSPGASKVKLRESGHSAGRFYHCIRYMARGRFLVLYVTQTHDSAEWPRVSKVLMRAIS